MVKKTVKVRFAPSPTGYLHIGGLRTALYNYLFVRQNQGSFVLRIEDTDQNRQVRGSEIKLITALKNIGLEWEEGPDTTKTLALTEKGQNGPYFQSKRLKIYQDHAKKLISSQNAYYCFCQPDRLDELRKEQQAKNLASKYDGRCRKLTAEQVKQQLQIYQKHVIRLKVGTGKVKFNDLIRGVIEIDCNDIDDQILIKSDGFPTYHLAVVVDDYLMGISHVIRGEEWLPSTPKHVLLYQAFGWPLPIFAHLPLLLNPDKSKLSKRQGDVAVEDFLEKGYLPEALINYVALMGWHPSDNQEIFSLKELIKCFSLDRIQKSGAVFDLEKLKWFNAYYIKKLPIKKLIDRCQKFLPKHDLDRKLLTKIINIERGRLTTINQIKELAETFLKPADFPPEKLIFNKSQRQTTLTALGIALDTLSETKKWVSPEIKKSLVKAVSDHNLTNGDLFWPVRVALSGQEKSPPPEEIMEIIGKSASLSRIEKAIAKLRKS